MTTKFVAALGIVATQNGQALVSAVTTGRVYRRFASFTSTNTAKATMTKLTKFVTNAP